MLNKVVESATALIDNQCQLSQYGFAKELSRFDGETDEDKREFWRDETQRVYEAW